MITEKAGAKSYQLDLVEEGKHRPHDWAVAEETPVSIRYNGEPYAVMLCSPIDMDDFARGFSLCEMVVDHVDEIKSVKETRLPDGIQLDIDIQEKRYERLLIAHRRREMAGQSGCGLCGLDSLSHVLDPLKPVKDETTVSFDVLQAACQGLAEQQELNRLTHSVHGAAWSSLEGDILFLREDIGRHNAFDKLIGAVLTEQSFSEGFAILTSRCGFELIQKAARSGISILVCLSAPTSLAIDLGDKLGITLATKTKDGLAVLTHGHRFV